MEEAQEVSNHAVLLLAHLNLQRKEDQFCDCVLRHRDDPGRLHPAHRCVLAASSPVLASLLSSAGVLVELQAPCFSDSVLAALLDYIYTGTLPQTQSQHQHHCLLSAACYLQMDVLRVALGTWLQTEVKPADNPNNTSTRDENQPHKGNIIEKKTATTFKDLPSTSSHGAFTRPEEIDASRVQSTRGSLERETHEYSSHSEDFHEAKVDPVHFSSRKAENRNVDKNATSYWNKTDASTLGIVRDHREAVQWTPQSLSQTISHTAEVHSMCGEDKNEQKDRFQSEGIIKSENWQKHSEEEQVRIAEAGRSSSSLPHACYEAVSVIRHSRRGTIFKWAEVSAVPPPVSQASLGSGRVHVSQTTSTGNDRTTGGIASKHKNQHGGQNQDKSQTMTQSQDVKDDLTHCSVRNIWYKFTPHRPDLLKWDYNSRNADLSTIQKDEHQGKGLFHNTHSKSSTKHFRDDTAQQKADLSFGDIPSKNRRLNSFESYTVSMETKTEAHSQNLRAGFPLPREDSNSGRDSHSKDLCPEAKVMKEHDYSSICPVEMNVQDSQSNVYGHQTNWLSNICRSEASLKDEASSQHGHESDNTDMSTPGLSRENISDHPFSAERHTSLETAEISSTETREPHLSLTMSVDRPMPDTTATAVSGTYCGHLQYQRITEDNTHSSYGGYDQKHLPPYFHQSKKSRDEEEVDPRTKPGHDPQRKHFNINTTDQVLLLDISTTPAKLLVSSRHISDTEETGAGKTDVLGTGLIDAEGGNQSRPGAKVIQTPEAVEMISNPREGENQISSWTVCPPSSVSDSIKASFSVCMPPTPSTRTPTDISAPLSTSVKQPFQCNLCYRSFSQRGSLNRHVRSHLGVRPFPCPCCPMTFSRQYRVSEHLRVHQHGILGSNFQNPPNTTI